MSVIAWSFKVTNIPDPPKGINEGSSPPEPEVLASPCIKVVDFSSRQFTDWWTDLQNKAYASGQEARDNLTTLAAMAKAGNWNLGMDMWTWATKFMGTDPPHHTVKLRAIASWEQIYENNNTSGSSSFEQDVTQGVTITDEETEKFGAKVGINVKAGWGPVSSTMSAEFSVEAGSSHSISFTDETTTKAHFEQPANSFEQLWQLTMQIIADDGPALPQKMLIFQSLTYPPDARHKELQAMSKESLRAKAEETVREMTGRR